MTSPTLHEIPSEQAPMALLLKADPSTALIAGYLQDGHCVVARQSDITVGVYVIKALAANTWARASAPCYCATPSTRPGNWGRSVWNWAPAASAIN